MARIAIAVGIGVAGALTGGLAAAGFGIFAGTFAGGSVLGGVLLGGSIGFSAGQLIGSIFLPPGINTSGPRLNDGQVSSSAPGSPIPWVYGGARLGGQIIWSSGIQESQSTTTQSAKGGPSQTSTTYSYTISFAAAFCEGPANISRIWGDSKLIYDATTKGSVSAPKLATGIGDDTVSLLPAIYTGSSDQEPDPVIQAAEGVDATPAFRGLCYIRYEKFPLADFGNRLPNIRGEASSSAVQGYLKDIFPPSGIIDPNAGGTPQVAPPKWCFVDAVNRAAYVFDSIGLVVQRIDLNVTTSVPLEAWQSGTVYKVGDQIAGSNNSVQVVTSTTSDAESGSTEPTWTDVIFDTITDHHVVWQNVGSGSEAIPITQEHVLDPEMGNGEAITGINAVPNGLGVDTRGNLWASLEITPADSAGNTWSAMRFDPRAMIALGRITLPSPVSSFQFQQTAKGDLVAFTTQTNFTGGGFIYFADAKNGTLQSAAKCFVTGTDAGVLAIVFDSHSRAYVLTYKGDNTYKICVADPRSGNATTQFFSFASDATVGNPRSLLWYGADNSLLLFTDTGYVIKIDVATMTVSATSSSAIIYTGAGYADLFAGMYPAGQVPSDGLVRAQFLSGSTFQLKVINASTLAVESTVDLSNWITGISQPLSHHSYDPSSNSIMCAVTSSTGSNLSFRLYLDRQAVDGETLDDVVLDLLERGGLDSGDADLTALSSIVVRGYPIARNPDVKGALSPLTQAYFFDLVESDFKIKAVVRGGEASFTIPETDLGLLADGYEVQPTFAQEHDLPKTLEVVYNDPAIDYQQNKQQRQRNARVKKTKNKITLQLPLTLQADDALQIADKSLQILWDERNSFAFKLWRASYLVRDPTDVGEFVYGGNTYVVRLTKGTIGQNFVLECAAVSEDGRNYNSTLAGAPAPGFVPQIVLPLPPTLLFLLDLPLLQDVDASPHGSSGYYYGMSAAAAGWPAGVLVSSIDQSNWNQVGFSRDELPFGTVAAPLLAPASPNVWDIVNTFKVYLVQGSLSSTSDLNVLNGANAALLGNEVLQFANATLNDDGSYTLSRLLRGRRGTEWTCSKHRTGETFILLTGGLHRNTAPTSDIGIVKSYKAVTVGAVYTGAQTQQMTLAGNDLKPYSPCSIKGTRNGESDLDIDWIRRTRIGGAWLDGSGEVPLAEDFEQYDVEIMRVNVVGTPGVTISPNPVLIPYVKISASGGGETDINTIKVAPFTATFADGHTADYPGFDFGIDGDPDGYVTVYDPTQQGGSGLTYDISADTHLAILPGYIYLGRVVFTSGAFNPFSAEIGGSDVVARTASGIPAAEFTYTADEQTTDFGSAQSKVRVRIYQISAQVGRGFPAEAIV